jgi:hypothetical protein
MPYSPASPPPTPSAVCGWASAIAGRTTTGQWRCCAPSAPDGPKLAADLAAVLAVKDPSHYGEKFVGDAKLEATMRAAARLVEAAETLIVTT